MNKLRRLRQLETENHELKKLVADLSLDKQMLQDVLSKKALRPVERCVLARHMVDEYRVSQRRAFPPCFAGQGNVSLPARG